MERSIDNRIGIRFRPPYHVINFLRYGGVLQSLRKRFFALDTYHVEIQCGGDCLGLLTKFCRITCPGYDVGERTSGTILLSIERL
jgi:hypothetical protein